MITIRDRSLSKPVPHLSVTLTSVWERLKGFRDSSRKACRWVELHCVRMNTKGERDDLWLYFHPLFCSSKRDETDIAYIPWKDRLNSIPPIWD